MKTASQLFTYRVQHKLTYNIEQLILSHVDMIISETLGCSELSSVSLNTLRTGDADLRF